MGKHKEKKSKKHKKEKKHKKRERKHSSSSSSESSSDEWVEKHPKPSTSSSDMVKPSIQTRDEWLSLPSSFTSSSNLERRLERQLNKRLEKERDTYNPRENVRELNPYWKDGGDGLPQFQKPSDDLPFNYKPTNIRIHTSNWRKEMPEQPVVHSTIASETEEQFTDSDLNAIAAKLVKAEIMGNTSLIAELNAKLERMRNFKTDSSQKDEILLTETDSKGYSRPLRKSVDHGEYSGGKRKKQKVETHSDNQRLRYFPDDDKYSLKQMFENERFLSGDDNDKSFMEMIGKVSKNDDLDDLFTDSIRRESPSKIDKYKRDKAISDHREMNEALDNCVSCLQSEKMLKHLMVSMSDTVYLSLPHHEPLTEGHCLLVPVRHASCSTQLDENEWSEILSFRNALTKMFMAKNEDVIFFETAMFLHRHPHMVMHCIPIAKEQGDLAPIYFKKAIDESEMEWASNKKLVSLAGRDIRRAIPKGLPYFSVSFGMDEGFAHVIEDQRLFPTNFAQEIIGGILDLHHSKWRKPKPQKFEEQKLRVLEFTKQWTNYDCTVN
ncbi:hypothetical protein PPYR_10668 [Photinus pyralis]|uniref:Cwf19-like C-terminal domain-containing protein n=1 Tax=Photinus pyralis TaxID=7054 RepID=A0A1Y1LIG8_PHOPY|nr:CWF19-like protein 2 homolog [Photinus pyralis]KAB0796607.1 hypothetical protein PPYR_10668 [Photinus pyralis]